MALQWTDAEFGKLALGDRRRDKRAKIILEQLASIAESQPDAARGNAVADSESDIHELLLEIEHQADNHDFILRGCQNRAIILPNGDVCSLDEILQQSEVQFEAEANVSGRTSLIESEKRARRKSRIARVAQISVHATQVAIRDPARSDGKLANVTLNVVEAIELNPPAGEEPIRWVLLTSLPIESIAAIKRVIQLYSLRWKIELFFKTLKSGIGIEKLKYETLDRYLTIAHCCTLWLGASSK